MNKRKSSPTLLLLGIFLLFLPGDRQIRSAASKNAYFSQEGRLKIVKTAPDMTVQLVETDGRNRTWILFSRDRGAGEEHIIGRLTSRGFTPRASLTHGPAGQFHSPDLDFTPSDQPWTVIVENLGSQQRFLIDDLSEGRRWIMEPPNTAAVFTPKLEIDAGGQAWLFWVAQRTGLDEIFYSRLCPAASTWTDPVSLTPDPSVPHFHPDTALNSAGGPMLVWSAFDGEDYEIYFSSWTGRKWTRPKAVTHNRFHGDAQPSLVAFNGIPAVAWTQAKGNSATVLFSYRNKGRWEKPVRLSPREGRVHAPKLLTQAQNLAISWQEGQRTHTQHLTFPPTGVPDPRLPSPRMRTQSSLLERNKFIGFGDSITYGSTNGPRMGLGYTPRLQDLLADTFQDPLVTNRGVPGEPTWEAVSRIHSVLDNDLALYLLLMEGTNDVSTLDYSLDSVIFNLRQILNACLDRSGFPLISTIIPRARDRWTASAKARTTELNRKIVDLASELQVFIVQNYDAFINFPASAGGHEALISSDNLHPNDTGYQVMAETWFQKIRFVPFPPHRDQGKKKARAASTSTRSCIRSCTQTPSPFFSFPNWIWSAHRATLALSNWP